MKIEPKLMISKLDAAKRQLETAIPLYFSDADPVSIHTLAGAAHTILSDLSKKSNGTPMFVSDSHVKDEYKKEVRKKFSEAKNHFKHADEDPEATINFMPKYNDFFLMDGCEKYIELTSEKPLYFLIFRRWFAYKYPDIMKFPQGEDDIIQSIMESFGDNKAEYFSEMLAVSALLK